MKKIYEKERKHQRKSREIIRSKKIFLSYTTDRVPCVGLDNGLPIKE